VARRPMSLSHLAVFRRGFAGESLSADHPGDADAPPEWSQLGPLIEAAVATGRGAFPTVGGATDRFVTHLGKCARDALAPDSSGQPAELGAVLGGLMAADLYLACAAGHGDEAAIEIVIRAWLRPAMAAACRPADSPAFVDDLTQLLRQKLLVASEDVPPKILSFSGRAPLGAWIAVVVQRAVSSLRRSEGTRERFEKRAAIEAEMIERDPELGYIKAHYADSFARAFQQALSRLTDRERSLLRLHNLHGVTLEHLAMVYGVDDSTISRWLARARHALVEETGRHMREAVGISASEFPSLARALTSQVDVSLNRWLVSAATSVSR
jgi:RNA polymerase sigma-70 factor (ECF subfamily)